MNLYKIYIATKKKDGTTIKGEGITMKGDDKESAITSVIKLAKGAYGYKGKVHICSIFLRDENKKWNKIQ